RTRPPPRSLLFPYTTLFRSRSRQPHVLHDRAGVLSPAAGGVRAMTRTHLVLLLAAGTVVGAVSGWLRPVPGMDGTADGESPRWFLPPAQVLERSSATQFTAAQ